MDLGANSLFKPPRFVKRDNTMERIPFGKTSFVLRPIPISLIVSTGHRYTSLSPYLSSCNQICGNPSF